MPPISEGHYAALQFLALGLVALLLVIELPLLLWAMFGLLKDLGQRIDHQTEALGQKLDGLGRDLRDACKYPAGVARNCYPGDQH